MWQCGFHNHNCKQRVVLNGKYSRLQDVLSGVPQGSDSARPKSVLDILSKWQLFFSGHSEIFLDKL